VLEAATSQYYLKIKLKMKINYKDPAIFVVKIRVVLYPYNCIINIYNWTVLLRLTSKPVFYPEIPRRASAEYVKEVPSNRWRLG
jgi:hypothetical protein